MILVGCAPSTVALPETEVGATEDSAAPAPLAPEGWSLLTDVGPRAELGHPVLATMASGEAVAVWLRVDGQERSLWASDGGEPFRLDDGDPEPVVASGRDPGLAVSGDEIAVVTGSAGPSGSSVDLWRWKPGGTPEETVLAESPDDRPVDQPEVVFEGAEPLVVWKEGGTWPDGDATLWAGRPGAPPSVVGGIPGSACPCCAHALALRPGGGVVLAVRADEANVREVYALAAEAGAAAFDGPWQVSFRDWWIPACPIEGPELASDGVAMWATWSDGATGDGVVWTARSDDGGMSWVELGPVAAGGLWDQQQPRIAWAGGSLWVATHEPDAALWRSADGGTSWEAVPLPLDFTRVALAADPDGLRVLGSEGGRRLWLGAP